MSFEQQYRAQPPPVYGGMENEVSVKQGGYTVKERQHGQNPCMQLLRFIRSNYI